MHDENKYNSDSDVNEQLKLLEEKYTRLTDLTKALTDRKFQPVFDQLNEILKQKNSLKPGKDFDKSYKKIEGLINTAMETIDKLKKTEKSNSSMYKAFKTVVTALRNFGPQVVVSNSAPQPHNNINPINEDQIKPLLEELNQSGNNGKKWKADIICTSGSSNYTIEHSYQNTTDTNRHFSKDPEHTITVSGQQVSAYPRGDDEMQKHKAKVMFEAYKAGGHNIQEMVVNGPDSVLKTQLQTLKDDYLKEKKQEVTLGPIPGH